MANPSISRTRMICYVCRDPDVGNDFYAAENGFTMVKCRGCGLLYVTERPGDDAISQAHQVGQHRGDSVIDTTGGFRRRKLSIYRRILEDIWRDPSNLPRTWLDIGCGHGEFLVALKEFSRGRIAIFGVEPNPVKRKSATDRGCQVDYFDLTQHRQTYGGLSLLNVFSHLVDPPQMLACWKDLLHPGGELLLQTGDSAHLSSEAQLRPLLLPDHLSFASQELVVRILSEIGFEILSVTKYPYIVRDARAFIRELAKSLLLKKSHLRYMIQKDIIGNTDMYIRARLT